MAKHIGLVAAPLYGFDLMRVGAFGAFVPLLFVVELEENPA
jgi:hypothetical protein